MLDETAALTAAVTPHFKGLSEAEVTVVVSIRLV